MTDPIPVPSGATVRLQVPGPPMIIAAVPSPAQVLYVPVPGPPGAPGDTRPVSQIVITGVAAVNLSGHCAVTRRGDGTIDYASNTNLSHLHAPVWITTGAASAGAAVTALAYGALDEPSWAWTTGPVFLGVDGVLTQTVPTAPAAAFLAMLATATSATSIFVDRTPSITLA